MKKLFLFLMAIAIQFSITAGAQNYTETFETATTGATTFTSNSRTFTITSTVPNSTAFKIVNYAGLGWNGTAPDNKFIDNSGAGNSNDGTGGQFTISSASAFTLKSMYLYLSRANTTFQNLSGSCTITGKLAGVTKFTATSSSGFNTDLGFQNGYTFINMTTYGGSNNSNISIDAFTITTTSNIGYIALDAMTWASGSSLSTSITGTTFCSGAPLSVSFSSSGYTFAAGNTFTAQLSDASGSFASPVNIGTLNSTATSGTIQAAIPVDRSTGFNYRVRVVSSNPGVTGIDNGTNFNIIKTSSGTTSYLAAGNVVKNISVSGTGFNYITDDDCRAVAGITPNGAAPVSGTTSVKMWIDGTQPATFVRRHYEITPASNATTATGRVTLYFTQADFDAFNAVNSLKLPTNSSDNTNKANLLIEKRSGTGNANGDFYSYPGAGSNINPTDADIVWNADALRWEVSFNVTGFSGFWVKTQATVLPVTFGSLSAVVQNDQLRVNWSTQTESNNDHFLVQASADGEGWHTISTIQSKALNGHSSNELKYEYSTPITSLALGASLLGLLLLGFSKNRPRTSVNRLKVASFGILFLVVTMISCQKTENFKTDSNSKIFIRIVQVDKDGRQDTSRTIQVVRE